MKIKELHLRNIASIEKADIDFDNDIRDIVTNDPAGIFLISGDTGTGKSVLLDGIAMALYRRTPRTAGVANPTQNKYTDTEGESININSIEQYTRLGISEKDDCYSELVFEGNDGLLYHARLDLGITRSNTDANGHRALKHRSPKWTVKVGNEDWQKVEVRTGQPILDAVGLTFEQFGRMAMLAQGQFASFLTGDKKERESILEQLTNTEKFTAYGMAIGSLFTKSKSNRADAQTTYDTEKSHTLSEEELTKLTESLAELQKVKTTLESERDKENATLADVQTLFANNRDKQQAQQQKAELENVANSEPYKVQKALVADWDSTNSQRMMLADKTAATERKEKATKELKQLAQQYALLLGDYLWRKDMLADLTEKTHTLAQWVAHRQTMDEVYTHSSAVCMQLDLYQTTCKKSDEAQKMLSDEKEKTGSLTKQSEQCATNLEMAKAAVLVMQTKIEKLTQERQRLQPNEINEEVKILNQKKITLEKLQERIISTEQRRAQLQQTEQDIKSEQQQLATLELTCKNAQKAYDEKVKAEEQTRSLLDTMEMSVKDKLTELRQRLLTTHAESCPLCGQSISHSLTEVDFTPILTPLQAREKQAKEELITATKNRDDAKSQYDTFCGSLKTKRQTFENDRDELKKEDTAVAAQALQLGLLSDQDMTPQIAKAILLTSQAIGQLEEKMKNAEQLLQEINRLNTQREPLDKALATADKALLNAVHAVDENTKAIAEWTKKTEEYTSEKRELNKALSAQLASAYPSWTDDTVCVMAQFKKDAEKYMENKSQVEKNNHEKEKQTKMIENISNIQRQTTSEHADWNILAQPCTFNSPDILNEWVTLNANVIKQDSIVSDAEKIIAVNTQALDTYFNESGKSEAMLLSIINAEKQVNEARHFVGQVDTDLKSRSDAIGACDSKMTELMNKMGITDLSQLPNEEALTTRINTLNVSIREKVEETGAIHAQLKSNEANVEKLAKAEKTLKEATAVFNKWERMNSVFGGTRFRTLVQTYILRPLLNNANIYLKEITDRYTLTCSEDNDQLSILVLDRYNKNEVRSVTVLSGGERFMISLALSLALSSLNRQDMNVNILFIDEGFGTLDENNLNSVMSTLEKLQEIAGQTNRRVGIISHREELVDRIPVKIHVKKKGEGRSMVEIIKS